MIRTVYGEAGREPVMGQVAVAHSILNRMESGKYGGTSVPDVVLSRNQYEPWSTRAHELMALRRDSPEYQSIAKVVDAARNGEVADPTGGATHFLNPNTVRERRGGSLPAWTNGGSTVDIGGHSFYAPDGRVKRETVDPIQAINSAIGANTEPSMTGMAYADNGATPAKAGTAGKTAEAGSLFRDAGFTLPSTAPSSAEPSSAGSLFTSAGFTLPGAKSAAVAAPQSNIPTPERNADLVAKYGVNNQPSTLQSIEQAIDPTRVIPEFAGNALRATKEAYGDATNTFASGVNDIREGNYAPKFPSLNPSTWEPGGILKAATGALGVPLSPLTGAIRTGIEEPASKIGGKEFGEKAGLLAGTMVPVPAARPFLPSTKAANALVEAIGPENVTEAVARMRANPRLSPMDVSDPVRVMAQGLVDPAQPKAMNTIVQAVKERAASLPDAVNSAYTKELGPAPDVVKLVEGLKQKASEAGKNEIQPALEKAKPVNVTPVLDEIDKIVKPGLQAMMDPATKLPLSDLQQELLRFKQQLTTGKENLVDPQKLHILQSKLGDYAYKLSQSPDGKMRHLGGELRTINEKLIDQIDEAANGAYRPARAKFKEAKDISQAFEEGFDTLKNRQGVSGLEDRPEALRNWVKNATKEELEARRLGTRADIDQKIRGVKNPAIGGENITKIDYNREKLAALFGEKEAGRLARAMDDAALEGATNGRVLANSKTAETLAAQKLLERTQVGGGNPLQYFGPVAAEMLGQSAGLPILGGAGVSALMGAHRAAQFGSRVLGTKRNLEIARAATSTGAAREEVMNKLLSHPKVISHLKKSSNALAIP